MITWPEVVGDLNFVYQGCDRIPLNINVSIEPDDIVNAASEHLVLELIAASMKDAHRLVTRHGLEPDLARAALLSPGTRMWSGWITRPTARPANRSIRCVLYAHEASS